MPYNETVNSKILKLFSEWSNTESKKMFGGVCHLMNGHMVCGVYKDYYIFRLGKDEADRAFELPFVKPFDITGKAMSGWIMVHHEDLQDDDQLQYWLNKARQFVQTLPPKKK
ncbi:MAG: TfoX/Sxy family protein [Calditrichia bacterium]